jgi:hypothetical protein
MSRGRKIHPFTHLRFLLLEHSGKLGVPLMIGAVLLLIAILAIPALPTGPVVHSMGKITGLGTVTREEGTFSTASILVDDRFVRMDLPTRHGCRVGDDISLRERRTRWGWHTRVAHERWPCSRPTLFPPP